MARIGYVSGGDSAHHELWCDTLTAAGHEVVRYPDATAAGLRRASHDDALDVFVAGPLTAAVAAVDAAVLPTIGISWASDLLVDAREPAVGAALRRALPQLSAVHLDSPAIVPLALEYGAVAERISVAPWGIDVAFFAPGRPDESLRAAVGGPDVRIVYSGRSWEPVYDVPVVIDGFARAYSHDPWLRLVLAGDGSQRDEIAAVIATAGLESVVHRVGRLAPTEVRAWLRIADVYVSASRSDGTSLSLLEALGVGLPCVVTGIAGNLVWVDAAATFAAGDAGALADALLAQLDADDAAARDARRELVRANGDRQRTTQVFLTVLQQVADRATMYR